MIAHSRQQAESIKCNVLGKGITEGTTVPVAAIGLNMELPMNTVISNNHSEYKASIMLLNRPYKLLQLFQPKKDKLSIQTDVGSTSSSSKDGAKKGKQPVEAPFVKRARLYIEDLEKAKAASNIVVDSRLVQAAKRRRSMPTSAPSAPASIEP